VPVAVDEMLSARRFQLFGTDGSVMAEPEFMSELRPGRRLARWYSDDTCRHERVALAPAVLLDPSAPILEELRGRFYRFKETLEPPELVEQIKLAEAESFAITRRHQEVPASITLWGGSDVQYGPLMASEGVELVPFVEEGGVSAAAAPGAAPLPVPDLPQDTTWLIVDPRHPDFVRERHRGPGAMSAGEFAMALDSRTQPVPVMRVGLADVGSFLDVARSLIAKIVEDDGAPPVGGLEDRLHEAFDGGTKTPPAAEDARTLTVDCGEHGERYKHWRAVCAEISYSYFGDWEKHHEGPAASLALFKNIQRQGGGRVFGVTSGAARRVCQIIEAYSAGVPGRANWKGGGALRARDFGLFS
ncbi:unnamed protein product, partial [Prorocentrum cordatum]